MIDVEHIGTVRGGVSGVSHNGLTDRVTPSDYTTWQLASKLYKSNLNQTPSVRNSRWMRVSDGLFLFGSIVGTPENACHVELSSMMTLAFQGQRLLLTRDTELEGKARSARPLPLSISHQATTATV